MQKRTEEVVLSIAKGISTATGHIFFQSLMKHLAESLGSDYAFIGELMKGHPGRVRTVVLWGHGRLADNFEYDLTGTPCADVVRQQLCGYRSGIQQLFPLDQLLADMRIEGYVGAPLRDANRRTLGLLVVMFEKPVENLALAESILNIFGVRAASELERQQREEALRESEQRLNLVLEATSSGLWDWNIQTGDVYFDERWIKSLGYSPEEVSPHVNFWEQIIHPEDLPRVRKAWRDHFQGRSLIYECENRLRTKSGTYRLNLDRGKVVEWDADGQPLRMVGTDTDITNRKQTEDQLQLTQFAIDRAADAIFIVDTNKRFLYVNNEACRSLEYTRDELMELTVSDIAPTHESEAFHKRFHILKETGVVRYETIHRTKSSRDIPIDLTINLFELNGTILMCAVARDITERKRAEQEQHRLIEDLTRSQQHFQTLFNWTPSAVGISTVAEGRFCDVNDGFSRLTGYAREEVIGHTTLELGLWADPEERAFVLREIREQGYLHNREGLLRTKSGEIRSLMVSVESIQLGSTPCLIYLGHDITERKRAEEALRLAKFSMERAADAVYWIDPQARILDVNEAASLMLGYSKEELCAMTVHNLNPDFQADMWPGFWSETRRSGTMVLETTHRAKNGRLIPIEVSVNYLSYEGKEYHCAFVRNITERKRTEEMRARLAAIVEGSDDAIIGNDLHGIINTWNQGAQQLFGYTAQETIGRSISILIPPDREDELHIMDQIKSGEPIQHFDTVRRRKDGSLVEISLTVSPIKDSQGRVIGASKIARDITARKRTQEEIRRSETFVTSIVENLPNMIFVKGAKDLKFVRFNKAGEDLLGHSREVLIGKSDYDLFLKDEADFFTEKDRQVFETGGLVDIPEEVIETKHQGLRILHTRKIPIYDETGEPQYLLGISEDITERKRAEEALRESEERYRTMMAYAPEAIVVLDVDKGRFVQVNENAVRLFGLSREALLQTGPIELSPPTQPDGRSSSETALGLIHAAVNGGTPVFEWVYRTASGEDITCEVRLVRLPASGLVLVRGSITDITARKQGEEALRESQGRFRELAENIKEVFWMSDPQKNEILYVSPAYEQIWGRTCESLYASPRSWLEAIHTDDRARILDAAVTKQATDTYDEEYRIVQPTGSTRWIHDQAFPVRDAAGTVCRIVGIAEDITERKQAENQVQQSLEQLRELSGQLEMAEELERKRIARELHDEFGQMITALKLDLTWLRRQHDQAGNGGQPDTFAYKLEAMEKVVNTMAQSTRRIASSLRPSVLDDLGLVPALQWQARDFQERTGLECQIRFSADVAQRQIDDTTATALFRIAQELLTNVIRHANAQRVQISLAADDDVLAMIVTDDGKGITENDLAKATSFGLRGIRERVALIGGEIKIAGAPHQGTIVTVRVPLARHK